jgi:predicted GNAT superfamily acetyltransferase
MTQGDPVANMASVTDLHHDPGGLPGRTADTAAAIDAAVQAADAAAQASGVHVRELSALADLESVYRLYDGIWRPDPKNPPVTTEMLRALTKAGNYVAGAYEGEQLLGACVGFFGAPLQGATMHSHIAGVSSAARGRSVGFALKLHQRAWAMLRGVSTISWTFDPLVQRNAYFNLAKLGAVAEEYLPNFYGGMHDRINGGDDTDRLLVRWDLAGPRVAAACVHAPPRVDAAVERGNGAVVALESSAHGRPVPGRLDGDVLLVAVPPDVESLRTSDPGCAKEWRTALREALAGLLSDGAHVSGFDRAGWYRLNRTETEGAPR